MHMQTPKQAFRLYRGPLPWHEPLEAVVLEKKRGCERGSGRFCGLSRLHFPPQTAGKGDKLPVGLTGEETHCLGARLGTIQPGLLP